MANKPTKPIALPRPQLTDEQRKANAIQFLAQRREQFAVNILCNLCQGSHISGKDDAHFLVSAAVEMADYLISQLYPVQEGEAK